jgi:DNA-binding beta-propeller fold protein YncE
MSARRAAVAACSLLIIAAAAGCAGGGASTPATSRTGRGASSSASRTGGESGPPAAVRPAPADVRATGTVSRALPGCTTSVQPAPALPDADVTLQSTPADPFGVAVSADGRWGFDTAGGQVGVFRIGPDGTPHLVRAISGPIAQAGEALSPDGRYLLATAGGDGAEVIATAAAEGSGQHAVLGVLTAPGQSGAGPIQVAVTPGAQFAFVSLEDADAIAVFSLQRALTGGFGRACYLGSIPTQQEPVGLAVSPDGRWLYSTSEGVSENTQVGSVAVISIARAETDPARSVVARVAAGCNPVRVITSADGRVVWVTARASDALLAFSAGRLRTDPARALLASVRVGELPVGLALAKAGSLIVVADSDRFDEPGAQASLAVVDVADALAGRAALIGYLTAGSFPRDVAASAGGQVVLVANFGSDQLESVRVPDLP